jgi:hypothetical protein
MSLEYLIVSYTHFLNGKHTNLGGPAQHLAKYLGNRAYCIWQPIPIGKPNWVYGLLKIRDILVTLCLIRKARVFVGIESLNAIVGAVGRKLGLFQKVIYWNLDFGPKRGVIWHFLDKLAIKYADEVWVLKDRGLTNQKVVPIGCWLKEIDLTKPRNPNGVVYIGLLEDMQGVGLLMTQAMFHRELDYTVIGTGKDEKSYKSIGLPNVWFTGVLDDESAQRLMCNNTYGWAWYHPDNPTIKTTMPTKIVTYLSCGLKPITNIDYEEPRDWSEIFKEVV